MVIEEFISTYAEKELIKLDTLRAQDKDIENQGKKNQGGKITKKEGSPDRTTNKAGETVYQA